MGIIIKKILFGILWTGVFYILLWFLFAIIYYLYAGGDYSNFDEGYAHGSDVGMTLGEMGGRIFILIISGVLSGILTFKGMLPGTKNITTISSESENIN